MNPGCVRWRRHVWPLAGRPAATARAGDPKLGAVEDRVTDNKSGHLAAGSRWPGLGHCAGVEGERLRVADRALQTEVFRLPFLGSYKRGERQLPERSVRCDDQALCG